MGIEHLHKIIDICCSLGSFAHSHSMSGIHYMLSVLVVATYFWTVNKAIDTAKFRTCKENPMCGRHSVWKTLGSRNHVSLINFSERASPDSAIAKYVFDILAEHSIYAFAYLSISLYDNGAVRLQVDEYPSSNADNRPYHWRYRPISGDVILEYPIKTPEKSPVVTESDEYVLIEYLNIIKIEINRNKFEITLNSDKILLNSRNLFKFEPHHPPEVCVPLSKKFDDYTPFGDQSVSLDFNFPNSVSHYGLPLHTLPFELPRDVENVRLFNLDVFEYELNSTQALYGSIPLLTTIHSDGSVTGLLWNNPSDTYVSISGGNSVDFVSESGIIDILVFVGPTPSDVLRQYHYFTGRPALPPLFSLGFHQSRYSYRDEADVASVSAGFTEHNIPCDVIWLDIDHTDGKRYLTWNRGSFRDPERMIRGLVADGRKLVIIVDPHIKIDPQWSLYKSLNSLSIRNSSGELYRGYCWPGDSVYPDFLSDSVRELWAEQFVGIDESVFIWNDMNEPSVFNGPELTLPKSTIHLDGTEHRDVHNLYGLFYHRATFEGLLRRSDKRPFVLSRSFYAGSHRYGPIWTGDNEANWSHLRASVGMILSLSISGMSFVGADVGGFFHSPNSELFVRWHQFASIAYPFYRAHSHTDGIRREPWSYKDPEVTRRVRDAVDLRYRLLPYLYTQFALYHLDSTPIIRPMWFSNPTDSASRGIDDQLMVGPDLLIKVIAIPRVTETQVYLPRSSKWYDVFGNSMVDSSRAWNTVRVSPEFVPLYARAGSIIPLIDSRRQSTVGMMEDPITLRIFPDPTTGKASGTLYLDDGETRKHEDGEYQLIRIEYQGDQVTLHQIGGNSQDLKRIEKIEFISESGKMKIRVFEPPVIINNQTIQLDI
jgi:alpha 1,3-glucosidase